MKARCGQCGNLFNFTPIAEEHGEYEITFAECDCGKRYFAHITNEKIRKRLNRTEIIKPLRKQAYIETTRDMMKELEEQKSELISEVIDGLD